MQALVTHVNGNENITVASTDSKLNVVVRDFISSQIKVWKNVNKAEAKLMQEVLAEGTTEDAMDLFNDLATKYDEYVFVKFATINFIVDA